jgi:hypothetical protein
MTLRGVRMSFRLFPRRIPFPSFPRKRESTWAGEGAKMDSRVRGNDVQRGARE